MKCPFQKYESEYSAHEKGQFMDCYEQGCMAYRAEAHIGLKQKIPTEESESRLAAG